MKSTSLQATLRNPTLQGRITFGRAEIQSALLLRSVLARERKMTRLTRVGFARGREFGERGTGEGDEGENVRETRGRLGGDFRFWVCLLF